MNFVQSIKNLFISASLGMAPILSGGYAFAQTEPPKVSEPAPEPAKEQPDADKGDGKKGKAFISTSGDFNLLPKFTKSRTVDPTSCAITKERSLDFGFIIEIIFPFVPFFESTGKPGTDVNCFDRVLVENLLQNSDNNSRAIAVALYDQLIPDEKKKIDDTLKAQGKSMEEIGRDWPRIVSKEEKKIGPQRCMIIHYQMPEEAGSSPVINMICSEKRARQPG